MAKPKPRGLPPSFQLDVAQGLHEGPVQPGDYLDDPLPRPPAPRPVEGTAARPTPGPAPGVVLGPPSLLPDPLLPKSGTGGTDRRKSSPRKQLNMRPETLRMVNELLAQIRASTGQEDAKASEMFHGLVSALYEARGHLDLSAVPSRGRWGTPTARAFPVALQRAFREAIAEWAAKNRR